MAQERSRVDPAGNGLARARRRVHWSTLALAACLGGFGTPAQAACFSPSGVYGEIDFNADYNTLQYCDDTNWVPMYFNDYWANGVTFDGTNDYLSGGGMAGVTDSPRFTMSFWVRRNGGFGSGQYLFQNDGNDFRVSIKTDNEILFGGQNSGGATVLSLESSTAIADTAWHHVMISFDLGNNASRHLYIDGISALSTNAFTDDTLDFTTTAILIGDSGSTDLHADLADFWVDFGTYIDLSDAANRAKFIDARGKPVHLGATGARVTGSPPDIFLSGDTATWHSNQGTGGGFTENGGLTDGTTNPSDHKEVSLFSGLVGHWKFNEGTGTTADDAVGSADATLTNGPTWQLAGVVAGAVATDASNDFIQIPAINLTGTNAVSVALWVNRTYSSINARTLFENSADFNGSTTGFAIFPDDNGTCSGGIAVGLRGSGGGSGYNIECYSQPTSGVWHHLVAVYDKGQATAANEIRFYIDGEERTPYLSPLQSNTTNNFGNNITYLSSRGGTGEFNANTFDDFRIYNRALTAAEIRGLAIGMCSSPYGVPGTMRYNQDYHVLQFCDGRHWLALGPPGDGGGGCGSPVGVEGELVYNQDWKTMQYCEGDDWIAIGKRCPHNLCGGTTSEKLVFVYVGSPSSSGNYGGVTGADARCQSEAAIYNLRGTYKAWLADSDPLTAPATRFIKASVPYKRPDGVQVADNWADLTDGTLDSAVSIRADGGTPGLAAVPTNVNTDGTQTGTANANHCTNWTSTAGNSWAGGRRDSATATWTATQGGSCSSGHVWFYCFEQ